MSFYSLPSTIIGNDKHKELRAAFSYYNIANSVDVLDLVQDALICARNAGFDVFNALDIMENAQVSGSKPLEVLWWCCGADFLEWSADYFYVLLFVFFCVFAVYEGFEVWDWRRPPPVLPVQLEGGESPFALPSGSGALVILIFPNPCTCLSVSLSMVFQPHVCVWNHIDSTPGRIVRASSSLGARCLG